LTGTYNDGSATLPFGPIAATKNSGNVWHYNVLLPVGFINILSATTTTSSGASVILHSPEEYGGDYQCGEQTPECAIVVQEGLVCHTPYGNEGAECGAFGLLPIGKDDGLTGLTFAATMNAYVAPDEDRQENDP
jgi:hypothetical protein